VTWPKTATVSAERAALELQGRCQHIALHRIDCSSEQAALANDTLYKEHI